MRSLAPHSFGDGNGKISERRLIVVVIGIKFDRSIGSVPIVAYSGQKDV